jgi:putative aldouronate transport system substrate-binding protein
MKKKFGFMAMVLMLSLSLVAAGCSKTKTEEPTTAATTAATAVTAAETTAPAATTAVETVAPAGPAVEVSLMYPGVPQKDVGLIEAEANKYLKDKLNITLKIDAVDFGQWDNKLNLLIASGEKADVIFTAAWQRYAINVAKGAFLDLGPLLDQYAPEIRTELGDGFMNGSKIDGKNYGIPTNKELAATRGLLMRKDLVEKYKIDLTTVKTWADLTPIFKTIKDNEPGVTPWYISNSNDNGILAQLDWDALGDDTAPGVIRKIGTSTKVELATETPEYLAAAKLIREWNKAGYINKDAATSTVFPHDQAKTGKVFAWADGLKPGKDGEETSYVGFPLTQVELTQPTISTGDAAGSMLAISKSSKNPELAMKLIGLLHSDKYLNNLINFGIEGVHYVKVAGKDNIIDIAPGVDAANQTYNPGANWELGNQFLNYLRANEDPAKWDKFKEFNAKGVPSPALGFSFNAEPVKTEIAATNNIAKQYAPALTSGSVDPEPKIKELNAKLKAAGADKVVAEKQKQFDAFLAAK